MRRVQKALDNSLLKVGLWQHDSRFPRLVGFARCTGDGVLHATVWDVAIHPVYQGFGLGKDLMAYVLQSLKEMNIQSIDSKYIVENFIYNLAPNPFNGKFREN